MSNSVDSVKRAAAGVTRKHSRLTIFAASAATAGVLGAAGLAVGSAPWSAAAGDASKTIQGGSQSASTTAFDAVTGAKVQLDAEHSTAASSSALHRAAHQAAQPAVKETAKRTPAAKHAPAKPAPKHAPAKPAAKHAPAKHAEKPRPHPKPKGEHTRPYAIYDSVTPSSIPHGKASAVYLNGAYKASARQMAHHKHVLWIDTNGSNPGADVLDVEPGDATPAGAAVWVGHRLHKHPNSVAIVYTMRSQWQAVKNHVSHLPQWMQHKVRYWIADPTGVEHDVRGADATQWYWGKHIDISKAHPSLTK
jgi:hypothetical protein